MELDSGVSLHVRYQGPAACLALNVGLTLKYGGPVRTSSFVFTF